MNPFNSEAGAVPAPTDPLELAVAREAARVVWRAVPYFLARYGERGRRFGESDGGWLVTLAGLPEPARIAQIDWLAGVLAPRGIPSWLLELQLAVTARAGKRAGWTGAAAMAGGAEHLARRRDAVLPRLAFARAGAIFAAEVEGGRLADGAGRIVASALVDVPLGYAPTAAAVTDWFAAQTPTHPRWPVAVQRVVAYVEEARRRP